MEDLNFAFLAPRCGLKPIYSNWSDIGTSQLNGGAINWGSIWSALKSFGSQLKDYGNRALHSQTASVIKQKLNDSNIRDKIAEGISTGIHGVVDIAQQHIEDAIQKRLHNRAEPDVSQQTVTTSPSVSAMTSEEVEPPRRGLKRPVEDEEPHVETNVPMDSPPAYDDIFPHSYASGPRANWEKTLSEIVGLGFRNIKRQRCF
nr:MAG: pVI protein [unidentified adenovirus]